MNTCSYMIIANNKVLIPRPYLFTGGTKKLIDRQLTDRLKHGNNWWAKHIWNHNNMHFYDRPYMFLMFFFLNDDLIGHRVQNCWYICQISFCLAHINLISSVKTPNHSDISAYLIRNAGFWIKATHLDCMPAKRPLAWLTGSIWNRQWCRKQSVFKINIMTLHQWQLL